MTYHILAFIRCVEPSATGHINICWTSRDWREIYCLEIILILYR